MSVGGRGHATVETTVFGLLRADHHSAFEKVPREEVVLQQRAIRGGTPLPGDSQFPVSILQLDILCNSELMGKDHMLKFIQMTRWRTNRDDPIELTYRRHIDF